MKLVQLDIQTLPGIQPGFSIEGFDPGINLVVAPNAGGKSSLLRALNYLISGVTTGDPAALALTAVFQDDETRWTVRRTGSNIVWERNGQRTEAPPLPAPDQLHCYWFSMEDLLTADARDEGLLHELRRTLSGGFDLDAVLNETEFAVGPRHGQAQSSALTEATRKRRGIEGGYESLKREESLLPELREKLQQADAASIKAKALAQALTLLDAREDRIQAESGLTAFPENMSKLRGDEVERLQKLETKREKFSSGRSAQESALEEALALLSETGLQENVPDEAEFDAHSRDLEELRNKEVQRKSASETLAAAEREQQKTLQQLGGNTAPPKLDPAAISEAETLARHIQQLTLKYDETKARMPAPAPSPDPREQAALNSAAEALRAWLNAGKTQQQSTLWIAAIAACLILIASVAGFLAGAWLAGSLAALSLGAIAWLAWTLPRDQSAGFRTRYDQSGQARPEAWTSESVRAKLEEIEMHRVELREAELRARQTVELAKLLSGMEPQLTEAESQKAELAAKLGFDPDITAAGLDRLVRLITDYENAGRNRDDANASISRLDEEISARQIRVCAFLEKWQVALPQAIRAASLAPALDALRHRVRTAANAQREIAAANREITRAETQLKEADAERAELLEDAGLTEGDTASLARCCEQFDAWKEQNGSLQDAKIREAEHSLPLRENPDLLRRVEAAERAELENELLSTQSLAEQATDLRDQITRIETRQETAGRDAILERASADEQAALESLEDALDKALYSDAANFLITGVRNEYRTGHEPELLQAAREQFLRFTHHAFRLEIDTQHGFMAFDTQQQALRQLGELSSGTRMQLLLAMRLAWTRKIEQRSVTLPLFLDEALTTSDEDRFKQVAASLEELVTEENRQIIYLSARRHEVALWEHAASRRPHVIDLAAIRFGNPSSAPEDFMLPISTPVPAPESKSPEAYAAELGVGSVDPLGEAGAISTFHILRDDLSLLYRLLENWRITAVGQLRSLLDSEAARHAVPDPTTRERLSGRCVVAEAWIHACREGRGKPVDRIALESSSAITLAFIDQVSELATARGGDAEAIIAALRANEIKRFRSTSVDQLEAWLQLHGFIDSSPELDPDGRERRVLEKAAAHAAPQDIRQVTRWLETGSIHLNPQRNHGAQTS